MTDVPIKWSAQAALHSFPVSSLSFIAVSTAFLFTVGYFSVVGLNFISLFSLQEHLVFSLTGVTAVVFIFIAINSIIYSVWEPRLNPFKVENFQNDKNRTGALFTLFFPLIASIIMTYFSRDYWGSTAALMFVFSVFLITLSLAFVMTYYAYNVKMFAVLSFLCLSMLPITIGAFSGGRHLYDSTLRMSNKAKLSDGTDVHVVRLGLTYTLVSPDRITVHAVPTASLKDIVSF